MEILLPVRKDQYKGCRNRYATLNGHEGHDKLSPTHGIIFCRLPGCGQKQQKLIIRTYSWTYFILKGLFHTDWLLFGCQRMDQVQKLNQVGNPFSLPFSLKITLNKLGNITGLHMEG